MLWRLLAVVVILAVLGGCSASFSGDTTQPTRANSDLSIDSELADIISTSNQRPTFATLLLSNTADPSKIVAYRSQVFADSTVDGQRAGFTALTSNSKVLPFGTTTVSASAATASGASADLSLSSTYSDSDCKRNGTGLGTSCVYKNKLNINLTSKIFDSFAQINPGYRPYAVVFSNQISKLNAKLSFDIITNDFSIDIRKLPIVDNISLTQGTNVLTGSTVNASFTLAGLNSAAGQRTIDWVVTEQGLTAPVFTGKSVCSGVATGETCTGSTGLGLAVQNASSAKLNLAFAGRAGAQYNVSGKVSYPVNAAIEPPRTATATLAMPTGLISVEPDPLAKLPAAFAYTVGTPKSFSTEGSIYPKGSKVYFSYTKADKKHVAIVPIGAAKGAVVTNPSFNLPADVRTVNMIVAKGTKFFTATSVFATGAGS
jgi:hypothetical protein